MNELVQRSESTQVQGDFTSRLRSRLSQANLGGQGRLPESSCLLLDISGSMDDLIGPNTTKLDELRLLAAKFTDVRRFEFHSVTSELKPSSQISNALGGTNLALAFMTIKQARVSHCVLITDGLPDSRDAAIQASKGLRIDVFYVGPDPAPQFLRDLALQTGGQYGRATLQARSELETKVRKLLGDGLTKPPITL